MIRKVKQQDYRSLYSGFKENPDQVIADAKEAGCTLSHFLDRAAPPGFSAQPVEGEGEGEVHERTDMDIALEKAPAFNRILHDEGLEIASDPTVGHYAVQANEFFLNPFRRALFAELCYQRARNVWYGGSHDNNSKGNRAVLLNSDTIPGEILNAFIDRPGALMDYPDFQPAIPLSEITAFTNFIPGQDYRSLYFQRDKDEHRFVRIAEGTPVPSGVLRHREHTISLPKRGRAIEFTYEMLRNPTTTIDRMLFQIQLIALESEIDLLNDAVYVLRHGDGNEEGSTDTRPQVYDRTDPDGGNAGNTKWSINEGSSAGLLKEEAWLAFEMQFRSPFMMTRILTRSREALELKRLTLFPLSGGNTTDAGYSTSELQMDLGARSPFFPTIQPINPNAGVIRMGYLDPQDTDESTLPPGDVIGFDHRLALERVVEVGSEIQEVENFVRSQTTVLVITENSNFAIFQPGAVKILDWN